MQSGYLFNYDKSLINHSNPFAFQLQNAFSVLNAFNSLTIQGTLWDIFLMIFYCILHVFCIIWKQTSNYNHLKYSVIFISLFD